MMNSRLTDMIGGTVIEPTSCSIGSGVNLLCPGMQHRGNWIIKLINGSWDGERL